MVKKANARESLAAHGLTSAALVTAALVALTAAPPAAWPQSTATQGAPAQQRAQGPAPGQTTIAPTTGAPGTQQATPATTAEAPNPGAELAQAIAAVISQPVFKHATFGVEFYSLDRQQPVYALNSEELFTPASTTKLLTMGTTLELLGPDYRYHTPVYRTGPVRNGTLEGNLVLVGSGDPNLSGRIQPDGTLAFENEDHAYDGSPDTRAVPGDPLLVIHELAAKIAAAGIRRVTGHVIADATLFPEGGGELGTGLTISPIVINDNIVDITMTPGPTAGAVTNIAVSPVTGYVRFVNQATTGAPGSRPTVQFGKDRAEPNGSHVVTITGSFPLGEPSILYAYAIPEPSRFAEVVLTEALRQRGVQIADPAAPPSAACPCAVDKAQAAAAMQQFAADYTPGNLVAEHVSPPLSEDLKVTLKVSQNLHASIMPLELGAVLGHDRVHSQQAGFDLEHAFLQGAGLDLSGASQGDGAGGSQAAFFTPDFMVHYLAYMSREPNFNVLLRALPILGRDGTLWNIVPQSPAAGHVFAKTGTFGAYDALNRMDMVTGKGLAGYFTTTSGARYAFAAYVNRVEVPLHGDQSTKIAGQALGQIAAAGYLILSGQPLLPASGIPVSLSQ
jgi:PBP4 family serine-type D-alanyl-D-alanine carboxypeptidase